MITKEAGFLLTWTFLGIIISLIFASLPILILATIPVLFLAVHTAIEPPVLEEVSLSTLKTAWTNETVEIKISGKSSGGVGVNSLYLNLPEPFRLEEGSNFHSFWKGFREKRFEISFIVRCVRRGIYELGPVEWRGYHSLNILKEKGGQGEEKYSLVVRPRMFNIRRLRLPASIASKPFPLESLSKIGASSTDFEDIREYVPGDPARSINWRASARRFSRGETSPLVNVYEKEGKQSVFIFLDTRTTMKLGTSSENALEYAVEATNNIAYYYLNYGFRLWAHFVGLERGLKGDTGSRQYNQLLKELIEVEPQEESTESLAEAVEKNRQIIFAHSPICIIVSVVNEANMDALMEGIHRLIKYRGFRRKASPILLLNVIPYHLIGEREKSWGNASKILTMRSTGLSKVLQKKNIMTLDWDPTKEDISKKLLRRVIAR